MITFENRYVKQLLALADLLVKDVQSEGYIDGQVRVFSERAERLGWVKLGSGYFSQAWSHPAIKEYAIKLGFKKEDSGALYAAYCRDNQGKVGIPVIHGLDRISSCYAVLMDKLISYEEVSYLYYAKANYYRTANKGKISKPQAMKDFFYIEKFFSSYSPRGEDDIRLEIHRTAYNIREFFKGISSFDLHEGNIMVDKHGQLVITDPVSFVKTCKKEHHELKRAGADFRGRIIHDEFNLQLSA